ncbi:MAG: NAD-dependent epimerase/dehydratase family protein [Bacteroidales bacterium]|nr:NAD-dependent epimerase/dehydratase family protein [Bacteroidales bacterium]
MKKILLLGGFGFIGSNILKYVDNLQVNPYEIIVFDKFKSHPYGVHFNCIKKVYTGNFSNINDIENVLEENKIDIVLHSLGTTIPITSNDIIFDIESNLLSTIRLLDLLVKYHIKRMVYISSGGAVYGHCTPCKKHNENDVPNPISSYGIVKLTIEKYLYYYSYLYNIETVIFRLSNPYGKYHYNIRQGVINVAAHSAISSRVFSVWGDGSARKDFIFINDFCDILFKLIEVKIPFLLLNVGSGQMLSVNEILKAIKHRIPSFVWTYNDRSIIDVQHFELDISKLLSLIGQYKFTPFAIGLEKTIKWIKGLK